MENQGLNLQANYNIRPAVAAPVVVLKDGKENISHEMVGYEVAKDIKLNVPEVLGPKNSELIL